MEEVTLGRLAEDQAARHPLGRPGRGRPTQVPKSSRPLIQSGRVPFPRRAGEGETVKAQIVSAHAFGKLALNTRVMETVELGTSRSRPGWTGAAMVREGDVIFSLSRPYQVAYIGPGAGAVAPLGFAIIRMDTETAAVLDPAYLAGWLSSSFVRYELLPARAENRFMRIDELYSLSVPTPPMHVQRSLGDLVRAEIEREVAQWEESARVSTLLDDMYDHMREVGA